MRILHLMAPAAIGGMERVVQMLALAQAERSHDTRVAAVVTPDASPEVKRYLSGLDAAGVRVYRVTVGGRAYAQEREAVARIVSEFRPDVVNSHGYRTDVVDGPGVQKQGAAFVVTAHGYTAGGVRNRIYEWVQRRSLRRCDAVVAVSRPLERQLAGAGIDQRRLHVVVNGWRAPDGIATRHEARRELDAPDELFAVGWVGRVSEEKGLDVAIRAMAELRDVPATLFVLGDGPRREDMQALARALNIAERVRWLGVVPGAARLFRGFDAIVCSSHTEGTPIVLLEAMAMAVPIVTTRVGGIPDILTDAEARLVPRGDSPAVAGALREVLRDPNAAAHRAQAARERLDRERNAFAWTEAYDRVYRAAITTARSRS